MKQALRQPLLDAEQLDIIKRQMITGMESMKSNPQGLAGNAFGRKMAPYPKDNIRYSPTIEESIERAENVTIEQVQEIHSKFLKRELPFN